MGLFKLEADGKTATCVSVKLDRSSVNTIEVVEGLKEGDDIILSDTANYDNPEQIRLN